MIQVKDEEDIYDVVSTRKVLPGVDEDELAVLRAKASASQNDLVIDEEDDDEEEDEEEEEDDDDEEEEVVAEMDLDKPLAIRSTAVLSSDILKRTVARMKLKREQQEKNLDLPEKRVKTEYAFHSMNFTYCLMCRYEGSYEERKCF